MGAKTSVEANNNTTNNTATGVAAPAPAPIAIPSAAVVASTKPALASPIEEYDDCDVPTNKRRVSFEADEKIEAVPAVRVSAPTAAPAPAPAPAPAAVRNGPKLSYAEALRLNGKSSRSPRVSPKVSPALNAAPAPAIEAAELHPANDTPAVVTTFSEEVYDVTKLRGDHSFGVSRINAGRKPKHPSRSKGRQLRAADRVAHHSQRNSVRTGLAHRRIEGTESMPALYR